MTTAKVGTNVNAIAVATFGVLILLIVGGIVTITHPDNLGFGEYFQDGIIALGLLGIGRGIDSKSKV